MRIAVAVLLAFTALISLATTDSTPVLIRMVVLAFTLAGAGSACCVAWQGHSKDKGWQYGWLLIGCAFLARAAHYGIVIFLSSQIEYAGLGLLRVLVGYLLVLQPVLLWCGLLAMAATTSPTERTARAIDSLLLGGSIFALIWWLGIEPALLNGGKTAAGHVGWARPFTAFGNATALAFAVIGALRAKNGAIGQWLMMLSVATLAASDFLFFWTISGAQPDSSALLMGACPLLLTISALWQLAESRVVAPGSPLENDSFAENTNRQDRETEIGTDERWSKNALFPDDADVNLQEFQDSCHELSLRWMTGSVAVVLPALAALTGIFYLVGPNRPEDATAPGELWWAPLLVCLAALRHAVLSLRSTQAMGVLLAYASSMQGTIAARTRQLTALHLTAAGLSDTPSQEQLLATALDSMLEAVHANAGAIWLRADFAGLAPPDIDMRGMGTLAASKTLGNIKNAAFLRRQAGRAKPSRKEEIAPNGHAEITPPSARWRLMRSQGYEQGEQHQLLTRMDEALQRGGLPHCAVSSTAEMKGRGSARMAAIRWKGEVIGAAGIVCWAGEMAPAEKLLLDSLAMEVGAALQNAHLYQEARRRADLDGVTDLFNHRTIQEHLSAELDNARAHSQELTIVMMDLNNFKFFNDTYGHPVGDKVLRIVARCLRDTCRTDDVIGRYGGDEFIALLPNTEARGALEVCSRIAARVEEEAYQDSHGRRIPIGLSFGASVFPHDGDSALELLSVADANLYEAKRGGAPLMTQRNASDESQELRQLKDVGTGGSFGILDALVTAIDNKDHYTRGHSEDVTHWAVLMALELDYSPET